MPADLGVSSLVRTLSNDLLRLAGFSEAWASRLKLVVDELFMNAVKYGSTPGQSAVNLQFVLGESVEFSICDDGTGPRKTSPEELQALVTLNEKNADITKTSGRGLAVITHLWTDELKVERSPQGGICVRFRKQVVTTPPPNLPAPEHATILPAAPIGPSTVFTLTDTVDPETLLHLSETIEKQIAALSAGHTLVLDFAAVDYINSTFIGHLAAWYNAVTRRGGSLALKNAKTQVQDVLTLVGLNQIIPLISNA